MVALTPTKVLKLPTLLKIPELVRTAKEYTIDALFRGKSRLNYFPPADGIHYPDDLSDQRPREGPLAVGRRSR